MNTKLISFAIIILVIIVGIYFAINYYLTSIFSSIEEWSGTTDSVESSVGDLTPFGWALIVLVATGMGILIYLKLRK